VRSYYEILGVAATASRDEIRRAYLAGARRLHPDTGAADQRGMQVLNEAWTVLRDPRRRRAYDRTLGLPAETPRASPTFVPLAFDDDEYVAADLVEGPLRPSRVGDTALLVPAGLLVGAIASVMLAAMTANEFLLALAFLLGVLAVATFLIAPLLVMVRQRRN